MARPVNSTHLMDVRKIVIGQCIGEKLVQTQQRIVSSSSRHSRLAAVTCRALSIVKFSECEVWDAAACEILHSNRSPI